MKTFKNHINHLFFNKIINRNSSIYLEICITSRCENNCRHCFMEKKNNEASDMSTDLFKSIINQAIVLSMQQGIPLYVTLIGGNVFLHPNLNEIVNYLYSNSIEFIIKGNPIDKKKIAMLKSFKNRGLMAYQLSIDGNIDFHDWLRGKGSFKKTLWSILQLRRIRIPSYVRITLVKENLRTVLSVSNLLFQLKINRFGFSRACNIGNYGMQNFQDIRALEYRQFLIDILNIYIKHYPCHTELAFKEKLWFPLLTELGYLKQHDEFLPKDDSIIRCSMFHNVACIMPNGDFSLCSKLGISKIGNVNIDSIYTMWTNRKKSCYIDINNYIECRTCDYNQYCLGCPAVSHNNHNGIFKGDPQCWVKT